MAEEPEALAVDTMFEDAVDALRQGERARGKEILTRLLKADQNNPNYWIWMSAAVDTAKERIYCLETALKLDPVNATAKRGLVLLGGLPPDENTQPFRINRPRPWEDDLLLAHEKPEEKGAGGAGKPLVRMLGIMLVALIVTAAAAYVFFLNPRGRQFFRPLGAATPSGPTATFTLTPTFVNATAAPTSSRLGPTPLAILLGIDYTPTPLYINTPRSPMSADTYRSAQRAYQQGNWDEYIRQMQQIQKDEPQAADVLYYIGEAYRLKGDCHAATDYYNQSLQVSDQFAPAYDGLAQARNCIDPGADTTELFDLAIQADANYGQAYLDRANFSLARKNYADALPDIQKAEKLMPDSALVQLAYAQAYVLSGDEAKALTAAQKANTIDATLLYSYYYLGYAYSLNGNYADAIAPLKMYLIYQPDDASANMLLGQALTETGDYVSAVPVLKTTLELDPNKVRANIYLGVCSLRTGDLESASEYFKRGIEFFPDSFDAQIGLTETMYDQGTFGSSYLQAMTAKSKASNDTQLALAIYWRALSQEGRKAFADAADDWQTLLAMPSHNMTPEMRQTAEEHLAALVTATPTPKGGIKTVTPTATPKPSGSGTPAATKTP